MRFLFAILLFVASSGMIFASYTSDAAGIEYDIPSALQATCGEQAEHGDRLLGFLSSGDAEPAGIAQTANKSTVSLMRYLACGLLDN